MISRCTNNYNNWYSKTFSTFSVSDYVGGGELLRLLHKHGPLPEELCRVYFAELVIIIGTCLIILLIGSFVLGEGYTRYVQKIPELKFLQENDLCY